MRPDIHSLAISDAISAATHRPFRLVKQTAAAGGCINKTFHLHGQDDRQFFLKLNTASLLATFSAEAAGLNEIAATHTVRVPQAVAHGITGAHSFLVLEHLDLRKSGDAALLGEQLAALHRVHALRFGFARGNFIGTTAQPNAWTDDWVTFWREQRLDFQFRLATKNGCGGNLQALGERLLDALPDFFIGYTPQPSLLHGDLWSGNHAFLADGTPTIFDPASYYGDREADLAMTELFGGYPANFYAAYRAAYPLDAGYARQAEQMMQRLLSELG